MDVCVHQLGLNVYKFNEARGLRIMNIAPKASNPTRYEGYPSIVEVGLNKKDWVEFYGEALVKKNNARIDEVAIED